MSAATTPPLASPRSLGDALVGRCFFHPALDYLLIGGGLSLLVAILVRQVGPQNLIGPTAYLWVLWFVNHTHFASSTVRLYTKPDAMRDMPNLTLIFPLIAIGVLTLAMLFPENLGANLQALYLTWSPFHYAAQAYGLAVMYSMRSGCKLSSLDKRLLRITCLLAFFHATLMPEGQAIGFEWLVPASIVQLAWVDSVRFAIVDFLGVAIFLAPLLLAAKVWRNQSGPMPLIALLIVFSNGVWWVLLPYYNAFFVATVFHGLQYLLIVALFHAKDQVAQPDNRMSLAGHSLRFYAISLALAYGLFYCLPMGYRLAGFGVVESMFLVVAVINVHHFVVDAFIWRVARDSKNRRIVEATNGSIAPSALPAA